MLPIVKELFHLLLQILTRVWIHQAKLFFVDEHSLQCLPFFPRLFRHSFVDLLSFWTWVGRNQQAWKFLVILLTKNHPAHRLYSLFNFVRIESTANFLRVLPVQALKGYLESTKPSGQNHQSQVLFLKPSIM